MRVWLALIMICGVAAARCGAAPNVIFIVAEHQGYGDFGFQGNGVIRTPHLDALAAESAQLETFYVSPADSATRASLLTGRFHQWSDAAEFTLAKHLKRQGYATALFGFTEVPPAQGFDKMTISGGDGSTEVAIRWLGARAEEETPFFLWLNLEPDQALPEATQHYRQNEEALASLVHPEADFNSWSQEKREAHLDELARVAALTTRVDANVGRLIAALEREGIKENTIVLFLVSSGPGTPRFVGSFRGMQPQVYEGGVRSPLLLHWPNRLNASHRFSGVSVHIDVAPTILEACGAELSPGAPPLDGRSFLAALRGDSDYWPERSLPLQFHEGTQRLRYHNFMLRRGDWKLLHSSGASRDGFQGEPHFELYNLSTDPGETLNLATVYPELVTELRREYDAWFDEVNGKEP